MSKGRETEDRLQQPAKLDAADEVVLGEQFYLLALRHQQRCLGSFAGHPHAGR